MRLLPRRPYFTAPFLLALLFCIAHPTPTSGQDQADAQEQANPVFFSLPCHPLDAKTEKDYGAGRSDPFQREMVRQAILLSAREEFGLVTRDPILGEALPDGQPPAGVDYALELVRQKPVRLWVSGTDKRLGPYVINNSQAGKIDGYRPMTWGAEAFSRTDAVAALKALGYEHNPTEHAEPGELPEEIQRRLYDMDLITQFYLARKLHALIRSDGQNRQRLAALSMVYSNLGQLTRYRLDLSNRALHARAFLYGCRSVRLAPERPEGYWALGYAWMMFDLPGYGNGPLKNAQAFNAAMPDPIKPPAWMALKPLYWKYDSIELMKRSREPGPLAELAAVLAAAAAETGQVNGLYRAVIENCRDVNPDTQRGYDTCFASSSWWLKSDEYAIERYERFHRAIPRLLKRHAEQVPAAVFEVAIQPDPMPGQEFLDIAKIAWALEDSGTNSRPAELSDAALGHQLEEMLVASAIDLYAQPSMNGFGRSPNRSTWDRVIQALGRNRYAELFELFRYSVLSQEQPRIEICKKVVLGDMNLAVATRLLAIFPDSKPFINVQGRAAWLHLYWQFTQNVPGLFMVAKVHGNRQGYRIYSSWLHAAAPNVPLRAITYIRHDDLNEQKLRRRLDRAHYMPGVLIAASEWYQKQGRTDEAYQMLWEAVQMVPDKQLQAKTAEFALQIGEPDIWLELMLQVREASGSIPPYENSELVIASTYMEGQKWDTALKWARIAYEKYPHDMEAMHLAWCMHMNGKTDDAIQFLIDLDGRTGHKAALMLCWQLNLQDQLDAVAKEYEQSRLPVEARFNPRRTSAFKANLLIHKGKAKQAIPIMRAAWDQHQATNDAIRLAILGEEFGDKETRDTMLNALAEDPGKDYRSHVTSLVAKVLLSTPDELPTEKEMRPVINTYMRWTADSYAALNFGWYLVAAGDVERGQKLLLEVINDKRVPIFAYERYMAASILRQSGYDMDKHRWRFPAAHDWPDQQ